MCASRTGRSLEWGSRAAAVLSSDLLIFHGLEHEHLERVR